MAPIKATDKQAVKDWDAYLLSFVEGVESNKTNRQKRKRNALKNLKAILKTGKNTISQNTVLPLQLLFI